MFPRYRLVYRYHRDIVYDRYFPSISSAIRVAAGFELDGDVYITLFDNVFDRVFNHSYICDLVKEFTNGEVLL